jgi:hypothetical protein
MAHSKDGIIYKYKKEHKNICTIWNEQYKDTEYRIVNSSTDHTSNAGIIEILKMYDFMKLSDILKEAGIQKRNGHDATNLTKICISKPILKVENNNQLVQEIEKDPFIAESHSVSPNIKQYNFTRLYRRVTVEQADRLNSKFIKNLQKIPQMKAKRNGLLICDPTQLPVYGKTYEGVAKGYDGNQKRAVMSYRDHAMFYTDDDKSYPIFPILTPGNVDTRYFLISMVKKSWNLLGVEIRKLAIDGGLTSKDIFKEANKERIVIYTKAKENVLYTYKKRRKQVREIKSLLTENDYKLYPELGVKLATLIVYQRGYHKKLRMVITKCLNDDDLLLLEKIHTYETDENSKKVIKYQRKSKKNPVSLICTDPNEKPENIVKICRKRWEIDVMHRETKQNENLGKLPTTKFPGVFFHLVLVYILFSIIQLFKILFPELDKKSIMSIANLVVKVIADVYFEGGRRVVEISCRTMFANWILSDYG